jgi:hypothetical protein
LAEGQTASETFTTVHRFNPVANADRVASPLEAGDSAIVGSGIYGPMVLAADGNLYGTTLVDDRSITQTGTATRPTYTPSGAGTIWRIVTGSADDRSDDQLEQVYSFVEATTGKTPKGLSVGAISGGKQTLIGATAGGTPGGNGGVYTFTVDPLPGSVSLSSDAGDSLTAGDSVTLNWEASLVQGCVASASAEGVSDWSGELATTGTQSITTIAGTTTYRIECEANNGEALSDSVQITAAAPPVEEVEEPETSSGGGGGGALSVLLLVGLGLFGIGRRVLR